MTKTWLTLPGAKSTCATAESSTERRTRDRPAGIPQHCVSTLEVAAAVRRVRDRRGGDDRAAFDRRSLARAGEKRKAGRWWQYHGSARRAGRRSDEDGWNRGSLLFHRSRVVFVPAGDGVAPICKSDCRRSAPDRRKAVVSARRGRSGAPGACDG